jgi:hypothetical protein
MLAVVALVSGCTAEIGPRPSISVPPNLSQRDVEVVILSELQSSDPSREAWFPESVEPGVIYAGYQRGRHYLRAAIRFDERTIIASISDSRNLDQSENRINEHAVIWMDQLEGRMRRAIGQAAAAKNIWGKLEMLPEEEVRAVV